MMIKKIENLTVILLALLSFSSLVVSLRLSSENYDPSPNPKSVVKAGKARFTILTEHLIRMEWDAEGAVNDAPTFAFVHRNLPTPSYNVTVENTSWTVIQTPALKVRYHSVPGGTFTEDNLQVTLQVNGVTVTWTPVTTDKENIGGNLKGTLRTLDGELGERELDCFKQTVASFHCQLGLVSRDGYVVVDDTNRPQLDDSPWPWVVNKTYTHPKPVDCSAILATERQSCGSRGISVFNCLGMGCCYENNTDGHSCFYSNNASRDLYFFGHGHDYKLALKEFTMVSGPIPIPPRFAFGVFFSHYWAYNDIGDMKIIKEYEQHQIPLDVLVTDMDWHITFYSESAKGKKDQAGGDIGWTGFSWDKHLFPNPTKFLDWCKVKGLKNTLNLHPFSGIQPWEERYVQMAKAMGIDPTTQRYVPFDPANKTFSTNWMKIILGEREDEGIDFWWLDWQQGEDYVAIPLVNPTFLLNHIFFTTPYHWKNNTVRPFILHRWGGLGNHRYQVGFSGDVVPAWQSLDFQVSFTLSATNVGFGYWSHDLGGHTQPSPPELYTRWVQWGTFSPMFRTHCTKNAANDRRIWLYPPMNYDILRQSMVLRASLVPYMYSQARLAYEEGLSLLRGMYYDYPEEDNAYIFDKQYFFGSSILVAPVTEPMDSTSLVIKKIWIPKGSYISWFSGEMLSGNVVYQRSFTLSETPVWVKAGSIVPMRTDDTAPLGSAQEIPKKLKLMVFVGDQAEGSFTLYEDDGKSTEYINGQFARTTLSYKHDSSLSSLVITVDPVGLNKYSGQPSMRSYQIVVPNFWPADSVTITGGNDLPYVDLRDTFDTYNENSWTYDGSTLSLIINVVTAQPVDKQLQLSLSYSTLKDFNINFYPGFAGKVTRLQQMKELLDDQWGIDTVYQDLYPNLLLAVEMGRMITYEPSHIATLAPKFSEYFKAGLTEVSNLKDLKPAVQARVMATLNMP